MRRNTPTRTAPSDPVSVRTLTAPTPSAIEALSDLNQWVSLQATGGGGSEGGAEGPASPVGSWRATVRSLATAFGG